MNGAGLVLIALTGTRPPAIYYFMKPTPRSVTPDTNTPSHNIADRVLDLMGDNSRGGGFGDLGGNSGGSSAGSPLLGGSGKVPDDDGKDQDGHLRPVLDEMTGIGSPNPYAPGMTPNPLKPGLHDEYQGTHDNDDGVGGTTPHPEYAPVPNFYLPVDPTPVPQPQLVSLPNDRSIESSPSPTQPPRSRGAGDSVGTHEMINNIEHETPLPHPSTLRGISDSPSRSEMVHLFD